MVYLLEMVIFHGKLLNNQMVYPHDFPVSFASTEWDDPPTLDDQGHSARSWFPVSTFMGIWWENWDKNNEHIN